MRSKEEFKQEMDFIMVTLDEKVLEVLEGKDIRQEDLLRQLKAEIGAKDK